jgi:hypothetical protein
VRRRRVEHGDRRARRAASRTLTVHRDSEDADEATLVRAVVHARLLGMRLLTLDARVVIANRVGGPSFEAHVPVAPPMRDGATPLGAADGDVLTARALLAQGADVLARTRSPGAVVARRGQGG